MLLRPGPFRPIAGKVDRHPGHSYKQGPRSTTLGQCTALEFDDALAVVFDGLRGHDAALVIFQFAIEFVSQFACSGNHDVERLLRMTRAWQTEEETHSAGAEMVDVVQIKHAWLDRVGHGEQHFAVPAMLSWRWKISISPKRRPLSRMFCNSAGPLKPLSSREITLITSTSSTGGRSLSSVMRCGGLSSGKSSSRLANRLGPSRSRFKSPCCGSSLRLLRLVSRGVALMEGRSCSSSCGSCCLSSTRDGPSTSADEFSSSSGRFEKLRSSLNFNLPLPPRIRRQPSKRIPAMTIMPMTISHSRRPISM